MHTLIWLVMFVGWASACGGGQSAAPPVEVPANSSAPDCASTGGAVARALAQKGESADLAAVSADVAKRCSADTWSAEAIKCLGAAHDKKGIDACGYEHLTQSQQDKLDKATAPLSKTFGWSRVRPKMEEFRDQFCACKDAQCAQSVSDAMTKWSQELLEDERDPPQLSDQDTKEAAAIGEQMGRCMQAAMAGGTSSAPAAAAPLSVTGIDPPKGDAAGGTFVRITGTNFVADGPRNVKVYFGKAQGTVVRFASDVELIVEAPAGKAKQTVDVTLEFDPGGEMKLPKAFTFVKK
jgi:hypothetical protein